MSFPVHDWQFWVATAAAMAAAVAVARMVLPRGLVARLMGRKPKAPKRRATLTLDGKPVRRG